MFCTKHGTTKLVYKRWGSCFEWRCPECEAAPIAYDPRPTATGIMAVDDELRREADARTRAAFRRGVARTNRR